MTKSSFSDSDIKALSAESKLGFLATMDLDGRLHVSLITTLMAKSDRQVTFGQFCEGESKDNVRHDPRTGFLVMTLDRFVWRGTARWKDAVTEGEDYELYNRQAMFRYNSYFGIHTVHKMDLVSLEGKRGLFMPGIVAGALAATALRPIGLVKKASAALKPWAMDLVNAMDAMKFIAYVGNDGYPVLVPMVPVSAPDSGRVLLVPSVYGQELRGISAGSDVAVFAMNMKMQSVMVGGRLTGWHGVGPLSFGVVEIDRVYNSMPPQQGWIYPVTPRKPVEKFDLS